MSADRGNGCDERKTNDGRKTTEAHLHGVDRPFAAVYHRVLRAQPACTPLVLVGTRTRHDEPRAQTREKKPNRTRHRKRHDRATDTDTAARQRPARTGSLIATFLV